MERSNPETAANAPGARWPRFSWRATIEVLIVIVAMLTYSGVRHLTEGAHDTAVRNAYRIVDLQELLWLNWDMAAHRLVRDSDLIVTLMN